MKFIKIVLLVLLLFISISNSLSAESEEEAVGYSVEPVIPDNQIDASQTYFDLKMTPSQKQELNITVWNSSSEEIRVKTSLNNPITNQNGIVDYSKSNMEPDESLQWPITDIGELSSEEITIAPHDSEVVKVFLEMPEELFNGIILGGVYFEKVVDDEETSGINIKNNYAYAVGIVLKETDVEVIPELNLRSVEPALMNYKTSVTANIQNSAPVLVRELNVEAKIWNANDELAGHVKNEGITMAPNTNMDFPIDWQNKALEPGEYNLEMTAEHETGRWEWQEDFVIEEDKAAELNEEAVDITNNTDQSGNSVYIVIIVALLGIIGWIARRKSSQS